jgi:S-(hydroxymethyl)glutathione dehydrogenase / alcohol dehydrogenase
MALMNDGPTTTRAAVLVEQNSDLVIDEISLPENLDVGQVLVELKYSGICGSQLGEIDGVKGPDRWLPHLLGHEGSGQVLAIGPGVKHVQPGDTVVLHWRPSRGIESAAPKYLWDEKTVNAGWVTTFNNFAVVSENRLTTIPAETDLKAAALYGCAVTTGFGVIDNRADIRLGETVVVFGAGGIGLNIVQAAALAGARTIVAIDRFANRLELAKSCGATETIDGSTTDPWERLQEIFAADALDVFIDNTGNPAIIAEGYKLTSGRGRTILVGVPKSGHDTAIHTLPLHFGKTITGTTGGEAIPHEDIPRYMALTEARNIDLTDLITEIEPLDGVNTLIAKMRNGESAGRCLIDFSSQ